MINACKTKNSRSFWLVQFLRKRRNTRKRYIQCVSAVILYSVCTFHCCQLSFCTMYVHVTVVSCHSVQCVYVHFTVVNCHSVQYMYMSLLSAVILYSVYMSLLSAVILYSVCTCHCCQLSFCTVCVHLTVVSCHSVQRTHINATISLVSL